MWYHVMCKWSNVYGITWYLICGSMVPKYYSTIKVVRGEAEVEIILVSEIEICIV